MCCPDTFSSAHCLVLPSWCWFSFFNNLRMYSAALKAEVEHTHTNAHRAIESKPTSTELRTGPQSSALTHSQRAVHSSSHDSWLTSKPLHCSSHQPPTFSLLQLLSASTTHLLSIGAAVDLRQQPLQALILQGHSQLFIVHCSQCRGNQSHALLNLGRSHPSVK